MFVNHLAGFLGSRLRLGELASACVQDAMCLNAHLQQANFFSSACILLQ
jgi:hypothetical protein